MWVHVFACSLFCLLVGHSVAVELVVSEGSAWLMSGEEPRRILSRIWLENGSQWQTSDDFRGGIIAPSQGSFTLAPARMYSLRDGKLLSRYQNEWQWVLDTGSKTDTEVADLPRAGFEAVAPRPVRLSRKGVFEDRVIQGSITLADSDVLETGPQGLTRVFLEGMEVLLLPRSMLKIGRIPHLLAGGIHVSLEEAASRRELQAGSATFRMLGQRAFVEILREDVAQGYSIVGVLAVLNARRETAYLLKPGEASRVKNSNPDTPQKFAASTKLRAWEGALLKPFEVDAEANQSIADPQMSRMMEVQTRAVNWREEQKSGRTSQPSQAESTKTTYAHWLDIPLAQDERVLGRDRAASSTFPGLGGAGEPPVGVTRDRVLGREALLKADQRRVPGERARLKNEVARRGVSAEDLRSNLMAEGSQLDQSLRFLVRREAELERVELQRSRLQRDKENLDRKLQLLQRAGDTRPQSIAFLLEDKRRLQRREQSLIEAANRLREAIQEARIGLAELKTMIRLRLSEDSRYLQGASEKVR